MSVEATAGSQGDIGAAAAAAAGVPGAGSAPASTTPASGTPAAPAAPTAPDPAASAQPPKQYQYAEDRSNWVPPHRLRETSTRAQQLERELYLERQRVAALSGVQAPAAPVDPEVAAIRKQFEQVFPELAEIARMADDLKKLKGFDPSSVQSAQDQYYETLGAQTLARLSDKAGDLFGGELSPMAKQSLEMTFGAWIYNNPDLHGRYNAQDPKLLDEFFTEYSKSFVDPIRRKVTTTTASRDIAIRRLPRAGAGSNIPGPGPRSLKPADTEEYHGAAFRALQQ